MPLPLLWHVHVGPQADGLSTFNFEVALVNDALGNDVDGYDMDLGQPVNCR